MIPDRIYLQWFNDEPLEAGEVVSSAAVCWSVTKVLDEDVEYMRLGKLQQLLRSWADLHAHSKSPTERSIVHAMYVELSEVVYGS